MNPKERHERISDLFLAACKLPPGQRSAFLEDACRDDPKLLADVEHMLREDALHSRFLETPALGQCDPACPRGPP